MVTYQRDGDRRQGLKNKNKRSRLGRVGSKLRMKKMTPAERLKWFVMKNKELKAAKKIVEDIKDEIAPIKAEILADFEEGTVTSTKVEGGTVYLHRDMTVAAVGGDTDAVVMKLRKARLSELIGIKHSTLKAFVKERCKQEDGTFALDLKHLPPSLRDVVQLGERFDVRIRQS